MMKEVVPDSQGVALTTLFVLGNASVYGLGARAGNDLWLAFLLAVVISLPIIAIYARLRSLTYDQPLRQGLANLFGEKLSRFLAFGYAFYAWRLACYVGKDLSVFAQSVSLRNTPQVVLVVGYALLALWAIKLGIEVLARWSSIYVKGILFFLTVIFALLFSKVDFSQFLPVLYNGFKPVFRGALELVDFPFLETIMLFGAFEVYEKKQSPYKVLLVGFLIAAFFLMIMSNASLAVLGTEVYVNSYFPVFVASSRIDLAEFATRLEAVVGLTFSIGGFLKIAVCLLVACKALSVGLGIEDYRFLVTPLVLAMIPGSQWFVKTLIQVEKTATKVVGPIDLVFQVALPVILWIAVEIRVIIRRRKGLEPIPSS